MTNPNLTLPTIEGVRQARQLLTDEICGTPLYHSLTLSAAFDADIWLKVECIGPISSFKARGAVVAVRRTMRAGNCRAVVTASTGNHGQGAAYAARMVGVGAHIFLPEDANPVKRRMIEALGATIHAVRGDIDTAKDSGRAFAASSGFSFLDDGDNLDIIEGAGTVGLEIAEGLDDIASIFVPVGGGSLASGIGLAARCLQPATRVIGVQSAGSPAMAESFLAGKPVECEVDTLAEGLMCRVPAILALSCLKAWATDVTTVTDDSLLRATNTMLNSCRLAVEPSGAAALAGAWDQRASLRGRRVVLVITGANISKPMRERASSVPSLVAGESSDIPSARIAVESQRAGSDTPP